MTNKQRELLRMGLLVAMHASGAYTPTLEVLKVCLATSSYPRLTDDEITAELLYLLDKGLVVSGQKTISPENAGWRITAAGRDVLAMEGLA